MKPHLTMPPIFAVHCVGGRWFAVAPSDRVHDRRLDRVRLQPPQPVKPIWAGTRDAFDVVEIRYRFV